MAGGGHPPERSAICTHGRVRTICSSCKPDPRGDFLASLGPLEEHWWPPAARRTIRRNELKALEAAAPAGRIPKSLQAIYGQDFWKAYDRLYPGGSTSSREWKWLSEAVRDRDGHRCKVCTASMDLQVDHIRPLGKGGQNAWSNLWTLCRDCHSAKTGRRL